MKLSEAIKRGAKLRPQSFNGYFEENKSCVQGAAFEGSLPKAKRIKNGNIYCNRFLILDCLSDKFPIINENFEHPLTKAIEPLSEIIQNLNDGYKWTREQIAEWVKDKEKVVKVSNDAQVLV